MSGKTGPTARGGVHSRYGYARGVEVAAGDSVSWRVRQRENEAAHSPVVVREAKIGAQRVTAAAGMIIEGASPQAGEAQCYGAQTAARGQISPAHRSSLQNGLPQPALRAAPGAMSVSSESK